MAGVHSISGRSHPARPRRAPGRRPGQLAEQQLLGQRPLDVLLDHARHGPRAHLRVVALLRDPAPRGLIDVEHHALGLQLRLHLDQQLVDHALDGRRIERRELDDRIQAIAELG